MINMDNLVKTTKEWAQDYVSAGFKLCAIRPKSKGPYQKNWGDLTLDTEHLEQGEGLGLIHGRSGTCVVDIDDMAKAEPYFLACGINIEAFLSAPDAVQINSNRSNRAKLLYKVPAGQLLPTHKRLHDGFEFRCAARNGNAMQDVLPPSIHPETNLPYRWDGDGSFSNIPELPKAIFDLWLSLGTLDNIGNAKNRIKSDLETLDPMTAERWSDIKSALGAIPSDDRDIWVMVGMALQPYDNGRELWEAWSSKSAKYDANGTDHIWHSFDPVKVTYRSIFELATKYYGWVNPKLGVSKSAQEAQRTEAEFIAEQQNPSGDVGTSVDFSTAHEDDPELLFYVDKWLPQGQVTLFAGHGGGGKSFAAMTLAVHVALGIDFGDLPVTQAITYFFSAEDNQQQIRKRVKAICKNLKYADGTQVHPAHLIDKLIVQDVTEIIPVLYKQGVTAVLARVAEQVRRLRAELVIVDNASDAFDGDEIRRNEVKGFIQALRMHLAGCGGSEEDVQARGEDAYAGAVLLLTHTNKASANSMSEEDYSGSTAWHNSARSRLSLVPDKEKDDVFYIKHMKANYSKKAEPITMQWTNGAFMPVDKDSVAMFTLAKTASLQELVLQAVALAIASEGQVSAAEGSNVMTHKTLVEYVDFPKGTKTKAYYEALQALTKTGQILKVERRKNGKAQYFYEIPAVPNADLL